MPVTLDRELERFWRVASDADVLRAAFPPGSGFENVALACVYHEFVRRELEPPPDLKYVPPDLRSSLREDAKAFILALVVFTLLCGFCVLLFLFVGSLLNLSDTLAVITFPVFGLWVPLLATLIAFRQYLTRARNQDRHTRCGVCGYILKGLTEPRCPECGERV